MSNKRLAIKLDNDKVHLADGISFNYGMTNLPKQVFNFKTHRQIYWEIEQKKYDSSSGALTVNVVDYNLPEDAKLSKLDPKYPINYIIFEKLDWEKFEPLLSSYTPSQLRPLVINYRNYYDISDENNEDVRALKRTAPNLFFNKREPVKHEMEIEMRVKYEDAEFDIERIVFSVHLKHYKVVKQLEIVNHHIRPEFEHIKHYIVKRLGNSFLTIIKVKLSDNSIEEITAKSEDISKIDEALINSIKVRSVLDLRHLKFQVEDKILYTTKELTDEVKKLSLIDSHAKDILDIFIKNARVKNLRQLEYLAQDKQTLNDRVLFTVKPLFGFIFHELGNKELFIWELLNSHGTYVWKNNDTEHKIDLAKIVEEAIITINNNGRETYKKYYKSIIDPPYSFGVIEHSSNNLTDDERFTEWKTKLDMFCA
jgi:hypothetical protein